MEELEYEKWNPVRKAIWEIIVNEKLNGPTYVNAWDLTDKIYDAIMSAINEDNHANQ